MPYNLDRDGNPKYQAYNSYMLDLLFAVGKYNVQYLDHKHVQVVGMESILKRQD